MFILSLKFVNSIDARIKKKKKLTNYHLYDYWESMEKCIFGLYLNVNLAQEYEGMI